MKSRSVLGLNVFLVLTLIAASRNLLAAEDAAHQTASSAPSPSPSDCTGAWRKAGWQLVPFPDSNAQYLSYQFRIPKGKKLSLKFDGEFPTARYLSYVVYDPKGGFFRKH